MSDEKRQDFEFQELVNYREQLANNMNYSIQRIDILIIALCTSGIVLATTTMSKGDGIFTEMKWALLFFSLSIFVNLISQFVGYHVSRSLLNVYNQKVVDYKSNPETFKESDYENQSNKAHSFTPVIHTMNIISFLLLVSGMVSCLLYYYCHF